MARVRMTAPGATTGEPAKRRRAPAAAAPWLAAGNRAAASLVTGAAIPSVQRTKRKRPGSDIDDGPPPKRRRLDTVGNWEDRDSEGKVVGPLVHDDIEPQPEDPDIDELIALFEQLRISFASEADGEEHEVYLSLQRGGEIIVESNPIPLTTILARGQWLGVPLGGAAKQLGILAGSATGQLAAYAKNRSHTNAEALRDTMRQVGHLLKHLTSKKIILKRTKLSKSADYGKKGTGINGSHVIADPLSVRSDFHGSAPGAPSKLMLAIRNQAKQSGGKGKNYKQMHLLNDNLFGPGEPWNLTPGTPQSNRDHETDVETPLKRAIFEKGLVLRYEAIVDYRNDPAKATDIQIAQNPDLYRFDKIRFIAKEYVFDPTSQTFTLQNSNDPDVRAVDGARINWSWGNIKPLVPKPNILKCTDPAELTAIGIKSGPAQRIVDFNIARPPFHPLVNKKSLGTTDKKAGLIALIKRYDGKNAMPANSFAGNKVYWSR